MKDFLLSTRFITGTFLGFVLTTTAFTFILTALYTPNILLAETGFYKDGKVYLVVEKSQVKKAKFYETRL